MSTVRWAFSLGYRGHRMGFVFVRGVLICGVILFWGVWGAVASPIPIDSIETLQKIGNDAAYPLDGDYILTQDIDASDTANWNDGAGFEPIGDCNVGVNTPFIGVFDGQGHIISGLVINRLYFSNELGVFNCLGSPGQIKNVGLRGLSITGSHTLGGLVGYNNGGIVTQCYTTGTVASGYWAGGLVGQNSGAVVQCFSLCTILGADYTGGLIGINSGGTVVQCYAGGAVSGLGDHTGGLIAESSIQEDVEASFWNIETSGRGRSSGGAGLTNAQMLQSSTFMAAGWDYTAVWTQTDGQTIPSLKMFTDPSVNYSLNIVEEGDGIVEPPSGTFPLWSSVILTETPRAGHGFNGWYIGDMLLSYNVRQPILISGDITLRAGFTGMTPIDSIEELQRIGNDPAYPLNGRYILTQDIDASDTANWNEGAGFVSIGRYYPNPMYFSGVFNGQGHSIYGLTIHRPDKLDTGLFGYVSSSGRIENLELNGVSVLGGYRTGGLVGSNEGIVTQCNLTGSVTGSHYVGGLIGRNEGTVTQCQSTGGVYGKKEVGGLVGCNSGTLTQCFAAGTVACAYSGGGLLGLNYGFIVQCFTISNVSGIDSIGGLAGVNSAGTMHQCYAAGPVSGITLTGGLVGANTAGSVSDSFWDMETTGQSTSACGMGITTRQALQSGTFITAGWNYTDLWTQADGQTVPHFTGSTSPEPAYLLTVSSEGHGTVSSSGGSYPAWSLIELTVEPDSGYGFAGWAGDVFSPLHPAPVNPLFVILHDNITLNALFLPSAPISIYTIEELQKIGHDTSYPLSWDYVIENNIDASATTLWNDGAGFSPIGSPGFPFTGSIHGQGHVLSGLTIHQSGLYFSGLVAYMAYGGRLDHIGLTGADITGGTMVGGLLGGNWGTVTGCYVKGSIFGGIYVGGLIGFNGSGMVTRCYTTGDITAEFFSYEVGGLIGENSGTVSQCYSTGTVTGIHDSYMRTVKNPDLKIPWETMKVSSNFNVTQDQAVGGLIGKNNNSVTQCYSIGKVGGKYALGGLAGEGNAALVSGSYWDTETSKQAASAGGMGKTTVEMMQEATFAEWDFEWVWDIVEGVSYPFLRETAGDSEGEPEEEGILEGAGEGEGMMEPLAIVLQPRGAAVYAGMEWPLVILVEGGAGPIVYDWKKDESSLGWPNANVQVVGPLTEEDAGEYRCVVSDGVTTLESEAAHLSVYPAPVSGQHAVDRNQDWVVSLSELLRVIQFYNSGSFHCDAGSEDGYAPEAGDQTCGAYGADYSPRDWTIGLPELLRVIQFFNSGCYHMEAGAEDGYGPGAGGPGIQSE